MTERLARKIIEQLSTDIAAGRLAPGDRLDEQSLASRFGVSRTPVREALRELAASGFAVSRARRGYVVTRVSSEELAEMFEAMSEVEALCARLAAHRMSPFERLQLLEIHRQAGEAARTGDAEAYVRLNDAFHDIIYRGTHNRYIEEMARSLRHRTASFRDSQFRDPTRLPISFESHARIVEAINGSRSEEAFSGMREHAAATGATALRHDLFARTDNLSTKS